MKTTTILLKLAAVPFWSSEDTTNNESPLSLTESVMVSQVGRTFYCLCIYNMFIIWKKFNPSEADQSSVP